MKVSNWFSVEETYASDLAARKGINNRYPVELENTIKNTAYNMDRVRDILGKPVIVNSWYRCPELNTLLGSKPTSQHIKGEAVDFICPRFGNPVLIARELVKEFLYLRFDQLIYEYSWIHISFVDPSVKPRNSVLTLLKSGSYAAGILENS